MTPAPASVPSRWASQEASRRSAPARRRRAKGHRGRQAAGVLPRGGPPSSCTISPSALRCTRSPSFRGAGRRLHHVPAGQGVNYISSAGCWLQMSGMMGATARSGWCRRRCQRLYQRPEARHPDCAQHGHRYGMSESSARSSWAGTTSVSGRDFSHPVPRSRRTSIASSTARCAGSGNQLRARG